MRLSMARVPRAPGGAVLTAMAALALCLFAAAPARAQNGDDGDLVQRVLPASVSVTVWSREVPSPGPSSPANNAANSKVHHLRQAFGSGFIIDPTGIIVTNRHVLEGAVEITVGLTDGRRVPAKVLASAGRADLALIKIDAGAQLPVLQFADSARAKVGDHVWVIGNPLGVGISLSSGVLSSTDPDAKRNIYDDYLQTDAPINRGSSGAPLVNRQGEVIGVTTSFYTDEGGSGSIGIGLAITAKDAASVVADLLRYGRVRAGWLDLGLQSVTPEIAQAAGLPNTAGAIVTAVNGKPSPDKRSVMPGDIILKFGDVTPRNARALVRAAAASPIGQPVQLVVWRHGQEQPATIAVGEWPNPSIEPAAPNGPAAQAKPNQAPPTLADLGLHLATAGPPQPDGVLVAKVDPHSTTSSAGISAGDVVVQVQDARVTTAAQAQQAFSAALADHRGFVLTLVRQRTVPRWIALPLNPATLADRQSANP